MSAPRTLALVLLLGGCSGDGAEQKFAELGIEVENELGARSQVACEPLPLLHGSRRLSELVIDDAFTITVSSSPNEAELTFEEGNRPLAQNLSIPRARLEGGYSEELTLLLDSGQTYFVSVNSGCTP